MSDAVEIKASGQYATTNKLFFKGKALQGNELIDVSIYIDKAMNDAKLKKLNLSISLEELPSARKAKPSKKS